MSRQRGSSVSCWRPLALCLLAVGGCGGDEPVGQKRGDQVGVPQPVPIPIDGGLLRVGGAPELDVDVHVLGLPGAVVGASDVRVINLRSQAEQQVAATAAGTFSLFIQAAKGDVLQVRAAGNAGSAELTVLSAPTARLMPPPTARAGVEPLTVEAGGIVLVRGAYASGAAVVGVNTANGATARATAVAGGLFELRLAAATGDALLIYGDEQPLADPWQLTVP